MRRKRRLDGWRRLTAKERSATRLLKWYDLMMQHQEDLAVILTSEQGKPLAEARGEIAYGAAFCAVVCRGSQTGLRRHHSGRHRRISASWSSGKPVGVCAAVTPWNFPAAMITRKVAPALARRLHHGGQAGQPDAV